MSIDRLPDYLEHMHEAAVQACSYVEGLSREDFFEDKRTQQAVILNLILIGEEATKLLRDDEGFADKYAQVPWRGMKGMRNRIAHGYFEINLETVWETVQTALPKLIQQLSGILSSIKPPV